MERVAHCPVCDESAAGRHTVHARQSDVLVECPHCHSLFADPRPSRRELLALYDREYYGEDARRRRRRWAAQQQGASLHRTFLRLLSRRYPDVVRDGARLLDFGTGLGYFLAEAQRAGLVCTGVELSDAAAEHARRRLGLDVRTGDVRALEALPEAAYDVVTAFAVLEHCIRPREALRALARKLAGGGLLAMSLPNLGCWRYRLERGRWFNIGNPTHLTFFALPALRRLLGELGLADIKRVVYYGGRPGFGPVLSLLQYGVRAANLGSEFRLVARKPAAGAEGAR